MGENSIQYSIVSLTETGTVRSQVASLAASSLSWPPEVQFHLLIRAFCLLAPTKEAFKIEETRRRKKRLAKRAEGLDASSPSVKAVNLCPVLLFRRSAERYAAAWSAEAPSFLAGLAGPHARPRCQFLVISCQTLPIFGGLVLLAVS